MIFPMIFTAIALGKSFRMDIMRPQRFLYTPTDTIGSHKEVIENPFTLTSYKMIESASDVFDFLNMEGELSLFLKSNNISISGTGEYLTKQVDRSKTVEILLQVHYQQRTETLPTYMELRRDLDPRSNDATHYIRSIVYGGKLLITYQMKSHHTENLEEIKAVVKASLETSGSVNAELEGKLEKINKNLEGIVETHIHAYYTGGIMEGYAMDLDGVFKMMKDFPKNFEEYTNKKGKERIIEFEVAPLSNIVHGVESPVVQKIRNEILDEAIDKYDDVVFAWHKLQDWFPDRSSDEFKKKVQDFKDHVMLTKERLEADIGSLNMAKAFDINHFDKAFKMYAEVKDSQTTINIPNRYTREMHKLMNDAKNIIPEWFPYTRAVNEYTHWGNVNCTLPSPDPVLIGVAASGPKGFASGSSVQCLGTTPLLAKLNRGIPEATSHINGLNYASPHGDSGPLLCARCLLSNATSVFTLPARKQCPPGTKFEYDGFMATGNMSVTDPVCIDNWRINEHEEIAVGADKKANSMVPMWIKCPDCRFAEEEVWYVPCVVCSR